MSGNSTKDYNDFIRANLPEGMSYNGDVDRYQVNDRSFFTYKKSDWYYRYISKFGYLPIPAILFANGEQGAWYDPSDLSTLFQDSAGTTPVTTAGQPVGLMLDKSQGLVLGPELVTNGDFPVNTAGWTPAGGPLPTISVVGGALRVNGANGSIAYQSVTVVVGKTYKILATSLDANGTIRIGTSIDGAQYASIVGNAARTITIVATSTSLFANLKTNGTPADFDNISIKLLPGNHATQATSAKRPTYAVVPFGGRRNLLEYTEQFDNAVWVKNGATVVANSALAPDGTTTADLMYATSTGVDRRVRKALSTSSDAHTATVYAKAAGKDFIFMLVPQSNSINDVVWFNVSNGTVGTIGSSATAATIEVAANGFYRCSVSGPGDSSTFFAVNIADADGTTTGTADGTNGVLIWGAQLEESATPTPYQKVVTSFDVTEAGVQTLHYLAFDGVDDAMATGTITPGVDKAQVFAGVRKLSDATISMICATSANSQSNAGTIQLFSGTDRTLVGRGRGTNDASFQTPPLPAAPHSTLIASLFDLSGATLADQTKVRVSGVVQTLSLSGAVGAGNFLAYPLYIGARAGTSFYFTGNMYGLIVCFGANLSDAQIASTEAYVAAKTGVAL